MNGFYNFARGLVRAVMFIPYRLRRPDNKSVPENGGLIVCANHSSLLDPVFIAISLKRKLTFMAKKELFNFKPFGKLISILGAFPVDREHNDVSAVKTAIKLLRGGHALLMFPQGKRCKRAENVRAKHGAVRLAIMTGVPILPVGVSEDHKAFRKKGFVKIGEPIDYSKYKGMKLTDEECDRLSYELMEKIYALSSEGEKND